MKIMKWLLTLLLTAQLAAVGAPAGQSQQNPTGAVQNVQKKVVIELAQFGIRNDGTRPVETTKGINQALQWASKQGHTVVSLPAGTYLIDKNSQINMVSRMTLELNDKVVLQKEANSKEQYKLLHVPYDASDVALKGGVYRGDKNQHDYSRKETPHTPGTHESGYGIAVEGATNVTIDGVKAVDFTGDGLVLGGYGKLIKDMYADHFVQGGLNEKGAALASKTQIRTKDPISLTHALFKNDPVFELTNAIKLPQVYDIYFFKANGAFLQRLEGKRIRDIMTIPEGAAKFHLVFNQAVKTGAYVELWYRKPSQNVVVKNSEFAFNRRQGITVGGADNVLIENNSIHDIKGTAPQSGIDLEGGYGENGHRNSNVTIRGNHFYNNAAYDVILYDGRDAIVENNHLASKGAIGLAVSEPFKGALVRGNHFDGTRIVAYHDVTFRNNRMNDSYTTLTGPNITIDGMQFTNSMFAISSKTAFGVSVSNVTITNTKKNDSGLSLSGKAIHLKNVAIDGQGTLRSFTGTTPEGSIFDDLKITGFNATSGLSLPPGTYNRCVFEGAEGGKFGVVSAAQAGKYVFDGCRFKSPSTVNTWLLGEHPQLDVTIRNSTFELLGNTQAISVQAAKNVLIEGNTIQANKLTSTATELIRINDYWQRSEKADILKAVIRGNRITSNVAAIGISTVYAGTGAPQYTVENNELTNAKLALKTGDAVKNNIAK